MKATILIIILFLLVSCDSIDPQVKNENNIQVITNIIHNKGMALDIDQLCPGKSISCIFPKTNNSSDNNMAISNTFWEISNLYPLTVKQLKTAENILETYSGTNTTQKKSLINTRQGDVINEYNLYKTKCAIFLKKSKMLNFASEYKNMTAFKLNELLCTPISDIPYMEEIPFFNNPLFLKFYKSSNYPISFYSTIKKALDISINYVDSLRITANLSILKLLEFAKTRNNQKKFQKMQSIISGLSIAVNRYVFLLEPYNKALNSLQRFDANLEKYKNEGHHFSFRVVSIFTPDILTFKRAYQAQRDLERARIMTALAIYRKTHNAYPNNLDVLATDILEHVPDNPMTGKSFRYTVMQNGEYELKDE